MADKKMRPESDWPFPLTADEAAAAKEIERILDRRMDPLGNWVARSRRRSPAICDGRAGGGITARPFPPTRGEEK